MASKSLHSPLHIKTPLMQSSELTSLCGIPIYLKLDNVQPSGSFKIRGIGNLVQKGVCINTSVRFTC